MGEEANPRTGEYTALSSPLCRQVCQRGLNRDYRTTKLLYFCVFKQHRYCLYRYDFKMLNKEGQCEGLSEEDCLHKLIEMDSCASSEEDLDYLAHEIDALSHSD